MNNSIEQAQVFVIFILVGSIIGIFFDCFRILRKVTKTSDLMTALEDGIFWILTGLFLIYMIFVFNNGEIRLFLILGAFVGLILYFMTISKFFVKLSIKIIQFVNQYFFRPILKVILLLLKPFKFLFLLFKKKVIICLIKIRERKKMLKEKSKKKKFTFFSKKPTKKEGIL